MKILEVLIFLIGLGLGSFLNVIIHRLPKGEKFFFDRSKCPQCGSYLKWYHNIPLLSFLFLKGRCAFCREKISLRYPLVEILTGILTLMFYLKFSNNLWTFLFFEGYLLLGLAITFIDLEKKEIPDPLNFSLLFLGLVFSFLGINPYVEDLGVSLLSALSGAGLLFLINEIYYLFTKRDGIGFGDFKLMAGLGAFFSYHSFYYILFYASLSGVLAFYLYSGIKKISQKGSAENNNRSVLKAEIPFGPFLFLGSLIYFWQGVLPFPLPGLR